MLGGERFSVKEKNPRFFENLIKVVQNDDVGHPIFWFYFRKFVKHLSRLMQHDTPDFNVCFLYYALFFFFFGHFDSLPR